MLYYVIDCMYYISYIDVNNNDENILQYKICENGKVRNKIINFKNFKNFVKGFYLKKYT